MCAQQAVTAVFSVNPLFLVTLLRLVTDTKYVFQQNHEKSEHQSIKNTFKKDNQNKNFFFQKSETTKMHLNLRVNLENHDVF